jgi:hypothetical protein
MIGMNVAAREGHVREHVTDSYARSGRLFFYAQNVTYYIIMTRELSAAYPPLS